MFRADLLFKHIFFAFAFKKNWIKHYTKNSKKIIFRTHSARLNHSLVVVEYAVQLPEAGVNISNIVHGQNVTPAQAKTVLHINKALIAT